MMQCYVCGNELSKFPGDRWACTNQSCSEFTATQVTAATPEMVNHPTHYGGADAPHEVIKCLRAWGLESDALLWNTVKYIARAGRKDVKTLLEDLRKAQWFLGKRIDDLEEKGK